MDALIGNVFFYFDVEEGFHCLVLAGLELRYVHQVSFAAILVSLPPEYCDHKNEPAFPDVVNKPFRKVLRTKKARGPLKVSLIFMNEVTGKGDVTWELWITQNPRSGF